MSPLRAVLPLFLVAFPLAAQAPAADRERAREIYAEMIRFNTAKRSGQAGPFVQAMARRFREAGFPEADIHVLGPNEFEQSLVVRYRGSGAKRPILLLAHLDVVPALKEDWTLDPFAFEERDGYYYGRGVLDDKGMAASLVANLLRLRAEGFVPERDLILALTSDEETGGEEGVGWLVRNHRALVDAEYALNEGAGGTLRDGKPFFHSVQAAEKVYTDFSLRVTNPGGHASVPRPDNAIYQLTAALQRLAAYTFPVEFNEVTRAFFERTATIEAPPMAAAIRAVLRNPRDAKAVATVARDPRYNAMLRTTCVATQLFGGHAPNALPQTARATVNCRMMPGTSADAVRDTLRRVLADTAIGIVPLQGTITNPPSELRPDVAAAVETLTKELFGNIPVIPMMSTGATDAKFLRQVGIPTYGVTALFVDPADARAHGRDERVPVKSFHDAVEFHYRLIRQLAAPAKPAS